MPRTDRRNRGWFRKGYDPRRHVLTYQDRLKGGLTWLRRHYLGGDYAAYLGQGGGARLQSVDDLAELAGHHDRPGRRSAAPANY